MEGYINLQKSTDITPQFADVLLLRSDAVSANTGKEGLFWFCFTDNSLVSVVV